MILADLVKPATEILGDKWTPHLLSAFFSGTSRFTPLQEKLKINPRTLSARLLALEKDGIILKSYPHPNSHCEYHLTQKGKDLYHILREMEVWSEKYYNP